nr:MAG TPA: hypothetical protein [Caudoviricetes sp.]
MSSFLYSTNFITTHKEQIHIHNIKIPFLYATSCKYE